MNPEIEESSYKTSKVTYSKYEENNIDKDS